MTEKEKKRLYYLENRDFFLEKARLYREKNKEKIKLYKSKKQLEKKPFCDLYRTCSLCKTEKIIYDFIREKKRKNGRGYKCYQCASKKTRESYNYEKKKAYMKIWRKNNKKIIIKNTKSTNEAAKKRIRTDDVYRYKRTIRSRIRYFIVNNKQPSDKYINILGADISFVRKYIERQFKKGMSWDNNGNGDFKWNLDHKIPLSTAKTKEDVDILNHYRNFQPLWSKENNRKRDKILVGQTYLNI